MADITLPLGAWEPDVTGVAATGMADVLNALPGPNGWGPFHGLTPQSAALASACKGLFHVYKQGGVTDTYAGTATKLYRYDASTLAWTDVSRLTGGNYAVPDGSFWDWEQYGSRLVAVNGSDAVQYIDIESGLNFAALGDTPPVASSVTASQDQIILTGLVSDPYDYAWSDDNNSEAWTPGVDGLADQQPTSGFGKVQRWCSEARLIIHERGLRTFVGTGNVDSFQFEDLATGRGTRAPFSIVEFGTLAAWIGEDDFYLGNAAEQRAIAGHRVFEYFRTNLYRARIGQVYGAADPRATRIYWAYPTDDTAYNDRIIGYDWKLDRWFRAEVTTYVLARVATAGTTLEAVDLINPSLDALTISLDSASLQGGAPILAGVGADLKLAYFDGTPLAATFETSDQNLTPMRRSRIRSATPIIEGAAGASATVQVGKRQRLADSIVWHDASSVRASGRVPLNCDGKFQRLRLAIPAGTWTNAQGMDVSFAPGGAR